MDSNKKVFVGNISHSANENDLNKLFSTVGTVSSVKIITDNFTGRSRGFGFVEMSTSEEADRAISELNNQELNGRAIRVDRAKQREGGGNGGNGGGANRTFKPRSNNNFQNRFNR